MAKYYGVERSEEYLAHYGVKGMHWGVRKAIEKAGRGVNNARLAAQYMKASKKLAKLSRNANLDYQANAAKKYGKIAKISGSIGASGLGLGGLSRLGQKANWKHFDNELTNAMWKTGAAKKIGNGGIQMPTQESFVANSALGKKIHKVHAKRDAALNNAKLLSAGIGAIGTAAAIGSGAKYALARYRSSTGGHAAAVAKRDEFKKEMNKAFKGTAYANGGGARQGGKRKRRR